MISSGVFWLLLCLGLVFGNGVSGQSQPSEFLRSFLMSQNMLGSNGSILQPLLKSKHADVATVSVYVDNWSHFNLVYTAHAVTSGALETSFPPRNLPEKSRSFGLRTLGSKRQRKATGGMVGWTLSHAETGVKQSRLCIAWNVVGDSEIKYALSLGDFVPQYDQMWETRKTGRLITEMSSDGLDTRIVMADSRVTVTAKMSRDTSRRNPSLHYNLVLTIVPQNIDVWGWAKYFKEGADAKNKARKYDQERQPLQAKKKQADEPAAPPVTSTTTTTSAARMETDPADARAKATPLYERKTLLYSGPSFASLQKRNQSLRDALRLEAKNHSVAVGLHLENWTRFRLGGVKVELQSGKLLEVLKPGYIDPGRQEVSIVTNKGSGMTGTAGVVRFSLGSTTDKVLSVMWSVPYNRQLWRTWVAVGLSSRDRVPSYKYMYSGEDPQRFSRQKGGREFEFSDGEFMVIARMDGGSTFKPLLHLGLLPIGDQNLAGSIKRQLGMPVGKRDDLTIIKDPPQSELVQSVTAKAASLQASLLTAVLTAIVAKKAF